MLRVMPAKPAKIAAGYWIIVWLAFFAMQRAGFDMNGSGAIPVAALTAPWSVLVIALGSSPWSAQHQSAFHAIESPLGTFVIFAILCGGLNAALLLTLPSAFQRARKRGW